MLNFMKGSIFSRSTDCEPQDIEPEKGVQVLAVWGSPGSGKTTVSVRLAKYLADKHKERGAASVRHDRAHAALHLPARRPGM